MRKKQNIKSKKCVFITLFTITICLCVLFSGCKNEPDSPPPPKTVETPTATPSSGQVDENTAITLATTTVGAKIYYTQDGTDPTTTSTPYSDSNKPVITTSKLTLKAIAVKNGMNNSEKLTATYTIAVTLLETVATPTASLSTGTYTEVKNVTLSCSTIGSSIYYTTNGSTPNANSILYESPFTINQTTTLKAIAIKSGWNDSEIFTAEYIINLPPTYDSVTISIPTTKADTVKSLDNNDNVIDKTFVVSGVQFSATVNGSNNPNQTVIWEISGQTKTGTRINSSTGLLTIATDEPHGNEITIKAKSTVDESKFDTKKITVVQCLPSVYFGKWINSSNSLTIDADFCIFYISDNIAYLRLNSLCWTVKEEAWGAYYNYGFTLSGIYSSDSYLTDENPSLIGQSLKFSNWIRTDDYNSIAFFEGGMLFTRVVE